MKSKIKVVQSKEEKQKAYNKYLKQYNKAIKEEFYLEAISIDYAICEEKLKLFLYVSGCINQQLDVTKKYRKVLRQIWDLNRKQKFGINKISSKYTYILKILDWTEDDKINLEFEHKVYQKFFEELKEKIIENIDIRELRNIINKLAEWCNLRNEIIHSLLNKSLEGLEKELENCAKEGFEIAKNLEAIVKKYEKNNDIRKKYKIQ